MGKILKLKKTEAAASLFAGWRETMIDSCLQGVMGEIYADAEENPGSAMAILGDFCFFAGKPSRELAAYKPVDCVRDFMIMVPQDESWAALIEQVYGERAQKVTRYAIRKEEHIWDEDKLREAVAGLPEGYELRMIEESLYRRCKEADWCRDLVAQYENYEQYEKWGLGAVILQGQEIVAGASSYSSYIGGIEIEIDTREDHRRKGLAYICGARLILECLARSWYPSWDAQNPSSAALAEKLGYHFDHAYTAYEIRGY